MSILTEIWITSSSIFSRGVWELKSREDLLTFIQNITVLRGFLGNLIFANFYHYCSNVVRKSSKVQMTGSSVSNEWQPNGIASCISCNGCKLNLRLTRCISRAGLGSFNTWTFPTTSNFQLVFFIFLSDFQKRQRQRIFEWARLRPGPPTSLGRGDW